MTKKLIVKTAKTVTNKVPAKRTHLTMNAFDVCENHVVHVEAFGRKFTVKSDGWYTLGRVGEGPIGFQRVHCLVKKGVALFATPENFMRPRMYKPLAEHITSDVNTLERYN